MKTKTRIRPRSQERCSAHDAARRRSGRWSGPIDDAGAGGQPDRARSSSGESAARTITVLIVEDESGIRETTADILRGEGYGISLAADGIEALGRLRNEVIDVVILDLHLPNMSGEAVLEALDDLPTVIVVSAFEFFNEDEIRERFGSKVFALLTKPVPPQRLLSVVADAARGRATD